VAKKFSARRYAQALFAVAQEKNRLDEISVELENVVQLNFDSVVFAYLSNPVISFKEKETLLAGKLPNVEETVVNLIYLLLANGRIDMLPSIINEYQQMVDDTKGVERAEVVTAVPLTDALRGKIAGRLGEMLNKKIVIEPESTDPGLIGGVVVKIGGKLLDGSTRTALNNLKKEIS